ncbi:hypothetical protein Tco_0536696 [Tanacetum coccineum]
MKLEDSEDEHQVYGRIVGIKRLLEVTTAQVNVTAVKQNTLISAASSRVKTASTQLLLTAGTKVNAAGLQLLKELLLSEG